MPKRKYQAARLKKFQNIGILFEDYQRIRAEESKSSKGIYIIVREALDKYLSVARKESPKK